MYPHEVQETKQPLEPSTLEARTTDVELDSHAPAKSSRYNLAPRSLFQHTDTTKESPKVVLDQPLKTFFTASILHLIPTAICGIVIWLDRKQVFWFEEDRPTTMNVLQFAAKTSEIAIVGSLSAMILHHTRRHLIGSGLPLGLFTSSYRASDVMILFEPSFQHSLRYPNTWRLAIFILFVALFSVLAGPAVAIALLPTPGWHAFPTAFSNATSQVLIPYRGDTWASAFGNSSKMLYNNQLAANVFNGSGLDCLRFHPLYSDSRCPGRHFQSFGSQFLSLGMVPKDLTFHEPTLDLSYVVRTDIITQGELFVTGVSTSPYMNLARTLRSVWTAIDGGQLKIVGPVTKSKKKRFSSSKKDRIFQPVVQAQCTWPGNPQGNSTVVGQLRANGILGYDMSQGWGFDEGARWSVPDATVRRVLDMQGKPSDAYRVEWVEGAELNATDKFSVAALVSIPPAASDSNSARRIIPCVFTAYWMPSTIMLDPQALNSISTNWTDAPDYLGQTIQSARNGSSKKPNLPAPLNLIRIDRSWAEALNIDLNFTENARGRSSILNYLLSGQSPLGIYYPNSTASERVVNLYLTNVTQVLSTVMSIGIANNGYPLNVFHQLGKQNKIRTLQYVTGGSMNMVSEEALTGVVPASTAQINIDAERYGYAYGPRNSTATFAFVVIYAYLAVLGLYCIYALFDQLHRHPHPITSWGGIPDVIVSALNSSRPRNGELTNCGGGVETSATWGQRLRVRVGEDERAEMVFSESDDLRRVEPGKKYK